MKNNNINKKVNLPFVIWIILTSAFFIYYRLEIVGYFGWNHLLHKDANPIPFRFLWMGISMFIPVSLMFVFHKFNKEELEH